MAAIINHKIVRGKSLNQNEVMGSASTRAESKHGI